LHSFSGVFHIVNCVLHVAVKTGSWCKYSFYLFVYFSFRLSDSYKRRTACRTIRRQTKWRTSQTRGLGDSQTALCLKNVTNLIVNNFYELEAILLIFGTLYMLKLLASERM